MTDETAGALAQPLWVSRTDKYLIFPATICATLTSYKALSRRGYQYSHSIVARYTCRIAIRERPDVRLGPHIMDLVAHSRRQPRHFAESHSPSRCRTGEIDDKDVHALDALA